MSIYLFRNGSQSGPHEESSLLRMLENREIAASDPACRIGASEWQPLSAILAAAQNDVSAVSMPTTEGGGAFVNQQAANWARQNLSKGVEIKLKYNSTMGKIGLLLFIFALPIAAFLFGVFKLVLGGGGMPFIYVSGLLFPVFAAVGAFAFLIGYYTRRKIVRYLTADGVETRNGTKHVWENLRYFEARKFRTARGNPIAAIIQSILFIGADRTTIEMIFESGKAIVPPLILDQKEILAMMARIPVERRGEGHN